MSENRRRSEDHPREPLVRVVLGLLFGCAAVAFGAMELDMAMGAAFVACGAMMKVNIGKHLPR